MLGGVANLSRMTLMVGTKIQATVTQEPAAAPHPTGQGACTPPSTPDISHLSKLSCFFKFTEKV